MLLRRGGCKAFWDSRSVAGEEGSEMVAGQGQRRMGVRSKRRESGPKFLLPKT